MSSMGEILGEGGHPGKGPAIVFSEAIKDRYQVKVISSRRSPQCPDV